MTMPGKLEIPFEMAEAPRIFLAWLGSEESTLNADQKKHINEWRIEHEIKLAAFLHDRYGHYVTVMAHALSTQYATKFWNDMNTAVERCNDDYLEQLDRDIFGNG
jgi:hypothetical protein